MTVPTPDLADGAQLRPRSELLAMIDDLVMNGMSSGDRSPLLSPLSEAAERIRLDGAALSAPADRDRGQTHGESCWSWGPRHYVCAEAKIAELLVTPPAPHVPEGWRLVLERQTSEMQRAGVRILEDYVDNNLSAFDIAGAAALVWSAMLDAAPAAPSVPVGGWRDIASAPSQGRINGA